MKMLLERLYVATPGMRDWMAMRHLRGDGLEIGAMHNPTRVLPGTRVSYVDYFSLEENRRRFPYLDRLRMVRPEFVEDGFALPSFAPTTRDFIIANHVLEHSRDPLGALARWSDILRPRGSLFVTVPLGDRCFDRGRPPTPLEHLRSDYEAGPHQATARAAADIAHYREWLDISLPNIVRDEGPPGNAQSLADLKLSPEELHAQQRDIHFHVFSTASFRAMLEHFCREIRPGLRVAAVQPWRNEVIGVVRKPA